MHPVLKALAITTAAVGGLAAAPASAHSSVGVFIGSGYGYPGWGGYGYAPPPYWGPPPAYWAPPVYGFGYRYAPRYWHRGWGYRGGRRYWHHW
jgi:hypothetical protein